MVSCVLSRNSILYVYHGSTIHLWSIPCLYLYHIDICTYVGKKLIFVSIRKSLNSLNYGHI